MSQEDTESCEVFLTEAARLYRDLSTSILAKDRHHQAARDLEQAAMLLTDKCQRDRALAISASIRSTPVPDPTEADHDWLRDLASLLDDIKRSISPPQRSEEKARGSSRPKPHFNTEESLTLRSFFRDEAHQHLELIINRLLEAGDEGPQGAVLDELLRVTHLLKGSAGTVGLPAFAAAAHDLEDVLAKMGRKQLSWTAGLVDAAIDLIDMLLVYVDHASQHGSTADTTELDARVATLMEQASLPPSRIENHQASVQSHRQGHSTDSFDSEQQSLTLFNRELAPPRDPQIIRVDSRQLDRLMDTLGELAFDRATIERRVQEIEDLAQKLTLAESSLRASIEELSGPKVKSHERRRAIAQLRKISVTIGEELVAISSRSSNLLDDAQALERTSNALQHRLIGIRMQSASTLFERLAPRVRAMARADGKRVHVRVIGGDTEFDRAVAEQVTEALIQLLRNAVAHGIEDRKERLLRGKPEIGLITLSARAEGESVIIEVSDDGGGLDTPALRAQLVELGIWTPGRAADESDDSILRAVFSPGVSSRTSADLLAGRGVGLGAARETIARLGGKIQLRSHRGHGTTFSVRVPLTTAVAHALMLTIGGQTYAIPSVNIVETRRIETPNSTVPTQLESGEGLVPIVSLQGILGTVISRDMQTALIVIIEYLGRQLAITCDEIADSREIVVKSLGPLLSRIPLYAGGTVSGSRDVQLILDPAALIRHAYPAKTSHETSHLEERAEIRDGQASIVTQERRILVVDDSITVRETITRSLESFGFRVDNAPDGAAAWEKLCTIPYEILITDIEMPELDGLALLTKVRSSSLASLPTLIISSRSTPENRARAAELGVVEFFAKPIDLAELERKIMELRATMSP